MSRTIDQKVVQMQFDNRQFEKNVQTTMSTLDKLKEKLNMTGASKGLEDVSSAAKKVDMSVLRGAVETVSSKFSAMEVMAITALANITNSAVNAGKRVVSALTIDPIKTGFAEYETQINAVQTILANTSSKGTTLDDVSSALDVLNTYADKTIYNFTEMTRNIGTFTAAGVDLDQSVSAIQGIANLAAVSGSSSQQASNAMYQLSQALAAGRVSLMDWNSVVNAGMGGQVFQDALKRTAKNMGIVVDESKSFRESISGSDTWLSSDVLIKTLEQFTMAAEEGSKEWDNYKKSLMDDGYTEAQATEILKMANTATDAATKVKTFTQLWDTLKESAQSGWTQSWEILVGDFEEAKSMLTEVSNVVGEMINKSSQARNELLQGWKDAGGRTDVLEGIKNAFNGVMAIITPIKEAFVDIFPPIAVEQLVNFTKGFRNLTKKFEEFADSHGDQIYATFKGIFSVLSAGVHIVKEIAGGVVELIKNFTGVGGSILDATSSIGDWLTNMSKSVKETDIFGKAIDKVVGFLSNCISGLKDFRTTIRESFHSSGVESFLVFFQKLWDIIKQIGAKAAEMFAPIGDGLARAFGDANLFDILNSGLLGGIFVALQSFNGGFGKLFDKFKGLIDDLNDGDGFLGNIKGAFEDLRGCFESYQNNLNAETLTKIATAIGILAGSIFLLSTIDAEALDRSVGYLAVVFTELLGSLFLFTKMDAGSIKGVTKACGVMTAMSISVLILSGALKVLASIDPKGLINGLIAIGVLMTEISLFLNAANFSGKKMMSSALALVVMGYSMRVMAKAVADFGSMSWEEIGKGLTAMAGALAAVVLALRFMPKDWAANFDGIGSAMSSSKLVSAGITIIAFAAAMKILASAMKDFAGLGWEEIGKGLAAIAVSLGAFVLALKLLPKNDLGNLSGGMVGMSVGMIAMAAAMLILTKVMDNISGMSWNEIGKGLAVIGGSLVGFALALKAMTGTERGGLALLVAAGALAVIAPVLKVLGGMSWTAIVKGLASLAGAFVVIGVAGAVLAPLIPTILGLAGAFALFGVSVAAIGAGVALFSVGLTALAAAGTAGAAAIVAALTVIVVGILDLIPTIVGKLGELILSICKVIGECAPEIALTVLSVVSEVLSALATYTPQIIDSLMTFLIGLIDGLAEHMPTLITSAVNLIGSFFQGVVDALSGMDVGTLFKGLIGIGLLTGLMMALSAVVGFIPGAMVGVIGMGAVVAELAIVLAAIGAFAQIPGLHWLINEGGELLEAIGKAIGKFVGGLAGGVMEGVTSSLPQIGSDLSDFMTNAKPFIEGAKSIDASMMEGVRALADTILVLTAADLLSGITSWITGGSSLTDFAEQLVPFGKAMKSFSDEVIGIDAGAVVASATAGKALSELANNLPNSGGMVSWFTGDNDIDAFADKLIPFGEAMKKYSDAVIGINTASVAASVAAGQSISGLANSLPNSGGFASIFSGDNDMSSFGTSLVSFGGSLKSYSDKVVGLDLSAVIASVTAANRVAGLIRSLTNLDSSGVNTFSTALSTLGKTSVEAFIVSFQAALGKLPSIGSNLVEALVKGFNSKKSMMSSNMTQLMNETIKLINDKGPGFDTAGVAVMVRFASGISSQKSNVKKAATRSLSDAVSGIRSYHSSFYSAGSYLADGLAAGISANSYKAAAKASAMASAAATAAKRALDIHSPSRVFYKIGDFAGQGLVNALGDFISKAANAGGNLAKSTINGLNSFAGKIGETAKNLGETAVESMTNPMSMVSDILNGDIDVQPGITPIIDLSNIESGARAINAMFSKSQAMQIEAGFRTNKSTAEDLAKAVITGIKDAIVPSNNDSLEDRNFTFNIPLSIDGREVARATATYTESEINKLQIRSNRKHGYV